MILPALGARLRNAAGPEEVIVVRVPKTPVDLRCGGAPMLDGDSAAGSVAETTANSEGSGTQLGKRYLHEASGMELLCVVAGPGSLSADGALLSLKSAKQLPASD